MCPLVYPDADPSQSRHQQPADRRSSGCRLFDPITLTYQWRVNGVLQPVTGTELDGSQYTKGDLSPSPSL